MGPIQQLLGCIAMAACAGCGCRDSSIVLQPPARGATRADAPAPTPGRQGSEHPLPEETLPIPDVPASAEPCTPEAEILALFDEYQTAFETGDGPRFLSLHTEEERNRQIVACLQIVRERFQNRPELEGLLAKCKVTPELLDVAWAHNANDPVESSVAVKTIIPRLVEPERLVTATFELLAASGPVHPELFNLQSNDDTATAILVLQFPHHAQRSELKFVRVDGRWLISAEASATANHYAPQARGVP
jgi:hypothetical protein